jgi:hypothetical protein
MTATRSRRAGALDHPVKNFQISIFRRVTVSTSQIVWYERRGQNGYRTLQVDGNATAPLSRVSTPDRVAFGKTRKQ